ncbi:MAG: hypothetical protein IJZ66_05515 [Oscillibacter sp.]|nr:hypothetical protein [Oscillibacter sp.]
MASDDMQGRVMPARGILDQMTGGALDADISAADFITVTAGGNDMMDLLYQRTAELYNASHETPIDPDDITKMLAEPPYGMEELILIGCAMTGPDG